MEQDDLMMNYGADPTIPNVDPTVDPTNVDPTIPLDPTDVGSTALDPTVIAVKTRRPQVKLTTERLLSNGGLPYVMKKAPKSIRISSRKNAQQNLSQIVQFYQLWAHELFPKAKFRDFIKLCETLGKTDKTLREYRSNLYRAEMGIDPIGIPEDEAQLDTQPIANDIETTIVEPTQDAVTTGQPSLFVEQDSIEINNQPTPVTTTTDSLNNDNESEGFEDDDDDDDLYSISTLKSSTKKIVADLNQEGQQPSQYEMDELMKEMEQSGNAQPDIPNTNNIDNNDENDYADDEEAFNDMEDQLREREQTQNIPAINETTIDTTKITESNQSDGNKQANDKVPEETNDSTATTLQPPSNPPENTSTKNTQEESDNTVTRDTQVHTENNKTNDDDIPNNTEEHTEDDVADTLIGNTEQTKEAPSKADNEGSNNKEEQENTEEQYMDATMNSMSAYGF